MDLLKSMRANREMSGLVTQMKNVVVTKTDPDEIAAGSKRMRIHIYETKPSKKVVKEHLEAIISKECESSSDEE